MPMSTSGVPFMNEEKPVTEHIKPPVEPVKATPPKPPVDPAKPHVEPKDHDKPATEHKAAEHKEHKEHKTPRKADLRPGGESGDPAVHALLAERQTLQMNQAALEVSPEQKAADKVADKRLDEIAKELAKLGYA